MNKLALQADLCYNEALNTDALAMLVTSESVTKEREFFRMDTIPQKQCTGCKNFFPATPEYFHHCNISKDGLKAKCRPCKKEEYKKSYEKAKEREHITVAEKRCTSCEDVFPGTSEFFHRNKASSDGLNSSCKACKTAYVKSYSNSPHGQAKRQAYRDSPEGEEKAYVHQKEYHQRPEVRERDRISDMERHRSTKRQEWLQDYNNRPEVIERKQAYMQVYRPEYYSQPENHEHKREQDNAYYHNPENHERIRAQVKEYHSRPETKELCRKSGRIASANRRARKRAIQGSHTTQQIQEQLKRQKRKCYYCATKFEKNKGKDVYHVDHTFPLSRVVGTDIPANDISYLVLTCPTCNLSKNDKFPWEWHEGGRLL